MPIVESWPGTVALGIILLFLNLALSYIFLISISVQHYLINRRVLEIYAGQVVPTT
jgi:hypothetical protein